MARSDRVAKHGKGVTRVTEKRNVTTGRQKGIRFTALDQDALSLMRDNIQKKLPRKNISDSQILRALGYLHNDDMVIDKLAQSIMENT